MVEGAGGGSACGKNQNLNSQKLAFRIGEGSLLKEADFLLVLFHHIILWVSARDDKHLSYSKILICVEKANKNYLHHWTSIQQDGDYFDDAERRDGCGTG